MHQKTPPFGSVLILLYLAYASAAVMIDIV